MAEFVSQLFDLMYWVAVTLIVVFALIVVVASCQYNPWLQSEAAKRRRPLLRGLDAAIDVESPNW